MGFESSGFAQIRTFAVFDLDSNVTVLFKANFTVHCALINQKKLKRVTHGITRHRILATFTKKQLQKSCLSEANLEFLQLRY